MVKEKKTVEQNVITIDFNVWCTIADRARLDGRDVVDISQRIWRTKKGRTKFPIEYWHIPQLNITLVKRED